MVGFCTGNHFCNLKYTMFPLCTWAQTQVWTELLRGVPWLLKEFLILKNLHDLKTMLFD